MELNCVIFVMKKLYFKIFLLYLDLDFEFLKLLDCGWIWTDF